MQLQYMCRGFLCIAIFILPVSLFSQPTWKLIKDKNGVKIYTSRVENSDLKKVKATCTISGTISKAKRIFQDVERQPQWVYSIRKAYIVRKISDKNFLYYVESSLPWPASDRYLLARMQIEVNEEDGILRISTVSDPDEDISSPGKIRIKHFNGKWEIRAAGRDSISVDYRLDINPGGSLPSSILNLFVSRGPYKSLRQLAELLK